MEHQDPKAGVSQREACHGSFSQLRDFTQREREATLKLFQKELSLFSTELRMFKPEGVLKSNGWCGENNTKGVDLLEM